MIKNNKIRNGVSFEVVIYRNGELQEVKQEFVTMTGEVTKDALRNSASHLIREGSKEVYEMDHGSCFGKRVTIERKLGNILNVQELPQPDGTEGINYAHAYAEDSRYNYNG